MAKEIGKSKTEVQKMINAFEMMMEAKDTKKSHWSYYVAYVSGTKIKKYRQSLADLDDRVVSLIKDEKFPRATDMRTNFHQYSATRKQKEFSSMRPRMTLSAKPWKLQVSAEIQMPSTSGLNVFVKTWEPMILGKRLENCCESKPQAEKQNMN